MGVQIKATVPVIQSKCCKPNTGSIDVRGAKKSPLPFHLVDTRSKPCFKDDMDRVLDWMAIENQYSIKNGYGKLFDAIGPKEICLGLEQERMLFFYLFSRLLGFVRVIELAENYWEIRSAISSPKFRRHYSGFNKLFCASSLLRISEITGLDNKAITGIMIITYNEWVARLFRNLLQNHEDRFLILKEQRFDFSRIKELVPEKSGKLIEIYDLKYKLLAGEQFFLFDVSACLAK